MRSAQATLPQVVECSACGFYIGPTPTCDVTAVEIGGRPYERIRYTTYDGKREHTCPPGLWDQRSELPPRRLRVRGPPCL
jgi:hypothetical protein